VYILILPAFGLISEMLMCYSLASILSEDSMVLAIALIGFLGCLV